MPKTKTLDTVRERERERELYSRKISFNFDTKKYIDKIKAEPLQIK